MLDPLYFILGVGLLSHVINLILESLEKGNYSNVVNLVALILVLFQVVPMIKNILTLTQDLFVRGL